MKAVCGDKFVGKSFVSTLRAVLIFLTLVMFSVVMTSAYAKEKRVALVIGNSAYENVSV